MTAPYSQDGKLETKGRLFGGADPEKLRAHLQHENEGYPEDKRLTLDGIDQIVSKLVDEQLARQPDNGIAFPLKHISTYRGDDIAIPWAIDGIIEQGGHTTEGGGG